MLQRRRVGARKNPVKRGYVNEAKHWRYSSARDYEGMDGLILVEKMW